METAKIFMNGRSEAVRLPKTCRFGADEVYVKKVGDLVLLFPKKKAWDVFIHGLDGFTEDFMNERPTEVLQKRSNL
jgi:antitoxin VapB